MSEQSQGLRFDVYERVHLPEEVAAIEELEEIELVPRIQVIQQGEQAILRGRLLLNGVYRSADRSGAAQTMEHQIPVEITLPMNRIESLEDISVEIDNFDVDLLSSRTLNITGVLSLSGIRVEAAADDGAQWQEEPYTVVHRAPASAQATGDISPGRYLELEEEGQEASFEEDETAAVAEYRDDGRREAASVAQSREEAAFRSYEREEDQCPPEAADSAQPAAHSSAYSGFEQPSAAGPDSSGQTSGWTQLGAWRQEPEPSGGSEAEEDASFSFAPPQAEFPPPAAAPRSASSDEAEADRSGAFSSLRSIASGERTAEPAEEAEPAAVLYGRPQAEPAADTAEPPVREAASPPEAASAPEAAASASAFGEADVQAAEAEPERQELRVAFGAKRSAAAAPDSGEEGLTSLIGSSRREREQRQASERSRQQEAPAAPPSEEVEWQSLFLSRTVEEQPFRKVRICIVQREETLDTIADRYQLQAREIALHNRLADQGVAEGQVLYIP
ncbi:LysM peptidoglycan-binding domain-containing protein [Paenibacillus pasadenensis]|uniref:Stage VI sporulation protein D n=1 Tax=Paenibacillus pasadenensis TaxID=217090 RepID=A0A2N5N9D6_9BACL|nr:MULTISPECIES: LysM peptidoglycan-binding domain-containing protein [Paenibacillus]PLT46943.1 Stage VI sporulation protein D [Paenibacillus pasadenensis]QGG57285.1 LysM peptidoglycan-binding domain-containing protein [Paenibacillus sp. B01]